MGTIKNESLLYNNSRPSRYTYGNKSMQIRIAELYIFLMPWYMISQLSIIETIFGPSANYFNFVLHLLGLLIMFMNRRGKVEIKNDNSSSLFHYFVIMVMIMNFASFTMAIILHDKLGTIGGEGTYRGVIGQIVYYIQYIFMIIYNREVFRMISKERIEQIINKMLFVLLALGYLQILLILFGGIFIKIHQGLDVFHVLWPTATIYKEQRLSLNGSEPAAAGGFICRLVLPFLMAKILYYGYNYKTILHLILWLPIIYFTKSSTAYFLFTVCFMMFIYYSLINKKYRSKIIIGVILLTLLLIMGMPFYKSIFNTEFIERIIYLLVDKVTNTSNQDAIARKVPLIVNYKTFLEYPILGVGNGNQGFFYIKYYPSWAYSYFDVNNLINSAKSTLGNGSLFIPSILSGYGILGVILVINYMIRCKRQVTRERSNLGIFYYMFIMSSIIIFIDGFSSDFAGNYGVWFLLSIPYMSVVKPGNQMTVK